MKKLESIFNSDQMLLQKIGLVMGAVAGLLIGMVVSERADEFEATQQYILEEMEEDGRTED